MTLTARFTIACAAFFSAGPVLAQAPAAQPFDTVLARRYFQEAARITSADGGRLWGRSLDGPLLLAHLGTRMLLADVGDSEGQLRPLGSLFTGRLPPRENMANTAITWAGRRWAMVMVPLPVDSVARAVLLAHELWHRVQDSLGFRAASPINSHLATRDGRLWLRLEGRALRRALTASGAGRRTALAHAVAFRLARRAAAPGADTLEAQLLLNEGLAEYTGIRLGAPDQAGGTALVDRRLAALDTISRHERGFAYQLGPAYGHFLDELAPDWRATLRPGDDLAILLEKALGGRPVPAQAVTARAGAYGYAAVRKEEDALAARRRARLAELDRQFVSGPTLELPLAAMNLSFDPTKVEAMGDRGTVYGSLRLSDRWGVLQCDASGGLISADFRRAVVPAPSDTAGRRLTGPGWVLELSPEWRLAPGTRRGDFRLMPATP
ncbi:MAG: hypothetical protein HOP28_11645 [Gemmatimonadales bacterium]|nr:hypothetical protein [Gemmatimonadales bacterium]